MLGHLLDALEKSGLAENTLVIVSADNGAANRPDPPLRAAKTSIYEGGHRVLFLARWPGRIKPGSVSNQTICLNDFMPALPPRDRSRRSGRHRRRESRGGRQPHRADATIHRRRPGHGRRTTEKRLAYVHRRPFRRWREERKRREESEERIEDRVMSYSPT